VNSDNIHAAIKNLRQSLGALEHLPAQDHRDAIRILMDALIAAASAVDNLVTARRTMLDLLQSYDPNNRKGGKPHER